MADIALTRQQLVEQLTAAFEKLIAIARQVDERGRHFDRTHWGPREIVAHLAGWEMIATVRIPRVAAGMPPIEFTDETQDRVMNDAINAASVTLIGDQPLDALCRILREAYQQDIEMLNGLDDAHFVAGDYIYERSVGVIDHCQEHCEQLQQLSQGANNPP